MITCGSKPISNILSASSKTTYVTLRRFVTRPKIRGGEKDKKKTKNQSQFILWLPRTLQNCKGN